MRKETTSCDKTGNEQIWDETGDEHKQRFII